MSKINFEPKTWSDLKNFIRPYILAKLETQSDPFSNQKLSRELIDETFGVEFADQRYLFQTDSDVRHSGVKSNRSQLVYACRDIIVEELGHKFKRSDDLPNGWFVPVDLVEAYVEEAPSQSASKVNELYVWTTDAALGFYGIVKFGKTTVSSTGRMSDAFKNATGNFEQPKLLKVWSLPENVSCHVVEKQVHDILISRGLHHTAGSGTEWFKVSVEEIDRLVSAVIALY